jgi:acyl-CoA synthetase (AMP-forming)/AMP-acid ligase II
LGFSARTAWYVNSYQARDHDLRVHLQDYITLVHSCLTIATPFALISSYSTPFELVNALSLSKVTRLFVDAKLLPKLLPAAMEVGIPTDKIYLLLGRVPGFRTVSELIDSVREKRIPFVGVRPVKNDTLAYLVFSSGTTGLPKGELRCPLPKTTAYGFSSCHDIPRQHKLFSHADRNRDQGCR